MLVKSPECVTVQCPYLVSIDLDHDLEHNFDGDAPGDHCNKFWQERVTFLKESSVSNQANRQTDTGYRVNVISHSILAQK